MRSHEPHLFGAAREAKGDAEGPELVRTIGALNEALSAHFDEEEAKIVPLARQHVTVAESEMLVGHTFASFKDDKPWLIYGLAREDWTDEERAMGLERMRPPM